jgi:hypothetical protein
MSGDMPEQDRRGLTEWWDDCAAQDRPEVPDQRGGPAYVVSFGWLPARLPPAPPSSSEPTWSSLIPSPRRALDDAR